MSSQNFPALDQWMDTTALKFYYSALLAYRVLFIFYAFSVHLLLNISTLLYLQ